ncbi:Asp23/Gls24 family envelope stress response protein [Devriesea agamarum]|uniref:Asp23/Gls24 family envelope stress response protein n=1 Tax=Devriesea agamarum TaxID=472569 RepID=UPI00071D8D57|nr:Asp23/Gls24 family envelope stress response protein [Devriesea agamarum]
MAANNVSKDLTKDVKENEVEATKTSGEIESPLKTNEGTTTIADGVVQKVAGMAARQVPGVHAMGSTARRALNAVTERIPGSRTNVSGGVSVETGEVQAAIDLTIIIEFGYSAVEIADQVRSSVIDAVEYATGLEVVEVNISISDVHLPDDDGEDHDKKSSRSDSLA